VKKIEPDECSSSVRSTPIPSSSTKPKNNNNYESNSNPKTSLLSSILSPNSTEAKKPTATGNSYADAKMAAQHREIERLVESRQRLHTLKDQIANLHQNMPTPPIPAKKGFFRELKYFVHRKVFIYRFDTSGNTKRKKTIEYI